MAAPTQSLIMAHVPIRVSLKGSRGPGKTPRISMLKRLVTTCVKKILGGPVLQQPRDFQDNGLTGLGRGDGQGNK